MKKVVFLLLLMNTVAYGQIKNFEDERNALYALSELALQSYTEHYTANDWDEGIRQHLEFDPLSMNFVFYRTPYDADDNGKRWTEIQWLAKFIVPLYEIDRLTGDAETNTISIRMKDDKNSIQAYHINSGGEGSYYPAGINNELLVQSDKLLKVRNLNERLNAYVSELQHFYSRKMNLVNFLNRKLQQELQHQIRDSLNYRGDQKFKLIQEFQLDSSGQWLSVIIEQENMYGNPLIRKQAVQLKDIANVGKDITVLLGTKEGNVQKTTTVINQGTEERKTETVDDLFFLHFSYEKNNEKLGDEIIQLFKSLGLDIERASWFD
ncbi:MAG: hypothetical protein ACT6QS_01115 [Flavobacteriales bacterium]